jgi:ABC-type polysaccharide/polyol phosphate export permease
LLSIILGLAFNLMVLIAVIFLMGIPITLQFLLLPIAFLGLVVFSFGVLLILSTLFPFFEDLSHLWDMLLVLGFWTSGVIFNGEKLLKLSLGYPISIQWPISLVCFAMVS